MEKLYQDFTNNILPKISEGLTITKDYFFDLFGRYINYLIVIDSLYIILCLLILIIVPIIFYKKRKYIIEECEGVPFVLLFFLIIPLICLFTNIDNLINCLI